MKETMRCPASCPVRASRRKPHKRPPMRNRSVTLLLALLGLAAAMPALGSSIITREFDSTALQRKWSYVVYLPGDYETSKLRYPVLYLLHGNGGGMYDWVKRGHIQATADALIASGEMPPAIIVMPDADSTWYVDRRRRWKRP